MKINKKKLCILIFAICGACIILRFVDPIDIRLQYAAASAAQSGDIFALRFFHLIGVDIQKSIPGRGPLIVYAAWAGKNNIIQYLLDAGVDINTTDKFGGTALSRAAQMGHLNTVQMLLNAGADSNIHDFEGGNTPIDLCLMNASRNGIDPMPIVNLIASVGGKQSTTKKGQKKK